MQRGAFFLGKVLINQIPHDSRSRTTQRLRLFLQERDMLPLHFQGDGFHAAKVFLLWQNVNTGIIVVLDNRVLTKQYGQAFLDALPKCPVEIV